MTPREDVIGLGMGPIKSLNPSTNSGSRLINVTRNAKSPNLFMIPILPEVTDFVSNKLKKQQQSNDIENDIEGIPRISNL